MQARLHSLGVPEAAPQNPAFFVNIRAIRGQSLGLRADWALLLARQPGMLGKDKMSGSKPQAPAFN